jgi:hypothetical protein
VVDGVGPAGLAVARTVRLMTDRKVIPADAEDLVEGSFSDKTTTIFPSSATEPWMIQFGGHHLGVNITLVGEQGMLAPSHTGAQPAIYEVEGKAVRPLGREVDEAFAW